MNKKNQPPFTTAQQAKCVKRGMVSASKMDRTIRMSDSYIPASSIAISVVRKNNKNLAFVFLMKRIR